MIQEGLHQYQPDLHFFIILFKGHINPTTIIIIIVGLCDTDYDCHGRILLFYIIFFFSVMEMGNERHRKSTHFQILVADHYDNTDLQNVSPQTGLLKVRYLTSRIKNCLAVFTTNLKSYFKPKMMMMMMVRYASPSSLIQLLYVPHTSLLGAPSFIMLMMVVCSSFLKSDSCTFFWKEEKSEESYKTDINTTRSKTTTLL